MALTNAEKQARFREKRDARVEELERTIEAQAAEIVRLKAGQAAGTPKPVTEPKTDPTPFLQRIKALERQVRELEGHLNHRQNAYGRLSHFHEQLKANKGLMSKKVYRFIVRCLHSDTRKTVTNAELDDALALFQGLRDVLEVKTPEERRAAKQAKKQPQPTKPGSLAAG